MHTGTGYPSLLVEPLEAYEASEYAAFRLRVLKSIMMAGTLFTALFVLTDALGLANLGPIQRVANFLFIACNLALLMVVLRRPATYQVVAPLFVMCANALFLSALWFVPNDELRVVWFFLGIGGTYILLGRFWGGGAALLTIGVLVVVNPYLKIPFSRSAIATMVAALAVCAVLFDIYTGRAQQLYERLEASNVRLRDLSTHDPLTGLLNSRAYYDLTDNLIRVLARSNAPCCVLFLDVDHFKQVNDVHGHEAGDEVLRQVARCLQDQCRHTDAIGRIGGEEFSVFLPQTDAMGGLVLADKLRGDIEALDLALVDGSRLKVTASIGLAERQPDEVSTAEVQRRADLAMYQAKADGRNRVATFEPAVLALSPQWQQGP